MSESDAREMIAEGKANFLPISGMSCASCEGAVATKLEKVAGVEGYFVNAAMGGAALMIAPSKMVKLSEVTAALGEGKFKINETASVKGMITLMIDGTTAAGAKEIDAKLAAIKGVKSEKNCSLDADKKCGTFTLVIDPKSEITIKTLRDALADMKAYAIKDMGFYGLPKEDKKS